MALSCLDSRYSNQLKDISQFLGDEAFVYYMAIWSLAYAELSNDDIYLPIYEDQSELYSRVLRYESETKHQMTALLKVLQKDFPKVTFHYGLTSEDIMHNARSLQTNLIIQSIINELTKVEEQIKRISTPIKFPILGHTHGQSATPIKLAPYLRAKYRDIFISKANFRFGGSNGQLSILRKIYSDIDFQKLGNQWSRKVSEKIRNSFAFEETQMVVPTSKIGLLQVGPHNDSTYLSGMSLALKMRALSRTFWDHAYRKILKVDTSSGQTGSSAMPHKVNPILFENAEGCFSIAYQTFTAALEANTDTRGLRDLSNSVINRQSLDGWAFLYMGVKGLVKALDKSEYDKDACYKELIDNPECLTEYLRYYIMIHKGKDPYFELKENPPKDFEDTLKRMPDWEFEW